MKNVSTLDIQPCHSRESKRLRRIMQGLDWQRSASEVLIQLYKEHPILYDCRHHSYYNRGQRQETLNKIIELLEEVRPATTTKDILKKIQTLRTQFGQEHLKIRRAAAKGQKYKPTVWWFPHLAFLEQHIKPRNSADDDGEHETTIVSKPQDQEEEYENYDSETYEIVTDDNLYEIEGNSSETVDKTDLTTDSKPIPKQTAPPAPRITYEIIGSNQLAKRSTPVTSTPVPLKITRLEQTIESVSPPKPTLNTIKSEEIGDPNRCRSLGDFVASQIASIKDDVLFYSTQMDVLNTINKSILEQLQLDKEKK